MARRSGSSALAGEIMIITICVLQLSPDGEDLVQLELVADHDDVCSAVPRHEHAGLRRVGLVHPAHEAARVDGRHVGDVLAGAGLAQARHRVEPLQPERDEGARHGGHGLAVLGVAPAAVPGLQRGLARHRLHHPPQQRGHRDGGDGLGSCTLHTSPLPPPLRCTCLGDPQCDGGVGGPCPVLGGGQHLVGPGGGHAPCLPRPQPRHAQHGGHLHPHDPCLLEITAAAEN